jgi:hypothetical protein
MFLLGAFLSGSAIGYAADRTLSPARAVGRPYTERDMRDMLQQKLNLTAAQRSVVDSAYDWRRVRIDEIQAPYRNQTEAVRDSTRQRVMAALDSSQKVLYMQMVEDMRNRADAGRRSGGDKR